MSADNDALRELEDIISLGQVETEFELPGRNKVHRVVMGVLWEQDVIEVKKRATLQAGAQDLITRSEIEQFEILVECIKSINEVSFVSDDALTYDSKKAQLREVLRKAAPYVITHLHEKYKELQQQSYDLIQGRLTEVKKSSGLSQVKNSTPDLK